MHFPFSFSSNTHFPTLSTITILPILHSALDIGDNSTHGQASSYWRTKHNAGGATHHNSGWQPLQQFTFFNGRLNQVVRRQWPSDRTQSTVTAETVCRTPQQFIPFKNTHHQMLSMRHWLDLHDHCIVGLQWIKRQPGLTATPTKSTPKDSSIYCLQKRNTSAQDTTALSLCQQWTQDTETTHTSKTTKHLTGQEDTGWTYRITAG